MDTLLDFWMLPGKNGMQIVRGLHEDGEIGNRRAMVSWPFHQHVGRVRNSEYIRQFGEKEKKFDGWTYQLRAQDVEQARMRPYLRR